MRVHNATGDASKLKQFADWALTVGNGTANKFDQVEFSPDMCLPLVDEKLDLPGLVSWVFPNLSERCNGLFCARQKLAFSRALLTDTEGNALSVPLFIKDSWGLVYVKGNETKEHNHWPSLWSYTFCVNACENCAPLVFPTCVNGYEVKPKTAQLIVFPAWIKHEVPVHKCNHERIMVAGNLNVGQEKKDAS